jgi:hypothetical protein
MYFAGRILVPEFGPWNPVRSLPLVCVSCRRLRGGHFTAQNFCYEYYSAIRFFLDASILLCRISLRLWARASKRCVLLILLAGAVASALCLEKKRNCRWTKEWCKRRPQYTSYDKLIFERVKLQEFVAVGCSVSWSAAEECFSTVVSTNLVRIGHLVTRISITVRCLAAVSTS